jgi:predicted metalloendopeptidase
MFNILNPKCACCNNPWNRGDDEEFALICGAVDCKSSDTVLSAADRDESISPAKDFFTYSNGGWMNSNPIPAEYPNWNTFLALHVQNQERLKEILKELQSATGDRSEEEGKLANFYSSAMNEEVIESAGIAPMSPILAACERATEVSTRAATIGELHRTFGLDNTFFHTGTSPDKKDANHSICQVSQGGLGLPDRDYYFDEDKAEKRTLYVEHVAKVLALVAPDSYAAEGSAKAAAEAVMAMETDLANSHMTKTEKRDVEKTYNKMSISALSEVRNRIEEYSCN